MHMLMCILSNVISVLMKRFLRDVFVFSKIGRFAVNLTTGDVYVNVDAASNRTLLDRETASAVAFMIEAIQGGGLRSFAQLTVNLEDANDNLPVMTSQIYFAVIQENAYSFLFPVFIQVRYSDYDFV